MSALMSTSPVFSLATLFLAFVTIESILEVSSTVPTRVPFIYTETRFVPSASFEYFLSPGAHRKMTIATKNIVE